MGIENRPFVGTWRLNQKSVIRQVPDALVYVNGKAVLPGCPTCGGEIDVQKYVSSITVDPSVEPIASANITLQIPKAEEGAVFRDGQFLLQTGLEINIYIRGYFPVTGLHSDTPPEQTGGVNVQESVMYPYYHVFHGVVTEVTHEYSGGEHTASMTCRDMLHFWSYQVMSTSGSFLGARPTNSGLRFTLVGHSFTGMTPYQIIYTLYRDVMGAAANVGFALGSTTNKDAISGTTGNSLWSMMLLYWEKRFSQNFNSLRMFGMDGTLYNTYQQAFLGRVGTNDLTTLAKQFGDSSSKSREFDADADLKARAARLVGFDPASMYSGAASERDAARGGLGINVAQIQAFVSDISNYGNVNLFETEYQTKLDMATTVREITGFEFYQDVDGDFVFKPPFYNLDTSESQAYVIRDVDMISFSATDTEPEATYVKATGSHFKNVTGLGLEGEWGTRSEFVDYRLVAQYGWREASFETYYITDPRAMFFASVNRLDLENIGIHSASCQIPIRSELRPGYPVYIEGLDCFFYLQSFNHSFTFGGQCTTSLNLVGRRAKFYPPGIRPENGKIPTVDDIKLDNPWLPKLPMRVLDGGDVLREQGFPNVVLAIDPTALNPNFFAVGLATKDFTTDVGILALIRVARTMGVLSIKEGPETEGKNEKEKWKSGPFKLLSGPNGESIDLPTVEGLMAQAQDYQEARNEIAKANSKGKTVPKVATDRLTAAQERAEPLQLLINAVGAPGKSGISDADATLNYLESLNDLKATFAPGKDIPGHYRYYSSAHPKPEMQGMVDVVADDSEVGTTRQAGLIALDQTMRMRGWVNHDGRNELAPIDVVAGIPLMRPNSGTLNGTRGVPTPTHQIGTIAFAQHLIKKQIQVPKRTGLKKRSFDTGSIQQSIQTSLETGALAGVGTVTALFLGKYDQIRTSIQQAVVGITLRGDVRVPPTFVTAIAGITDESGSPLTTTSLIEEAFPSDTISGISTTSIYLAQGLARAASANFQARYAELEQDYGVVSGSDDAAKVAAFDRLTLAWSNLFQSFDAGSPAGTTDSDTVMVTQTVEIATYSPVFPVSDGKGYEVVGSYLYGRGLSTRVGGAFQTLLGKERFDYVSADAVDAFLNTLINGENASKAVSPGAVLGLLAESDPEAAAELAVAAGYRGGSTQEVLSLATADPTLFETAFRNFVSTTKQASQKVSAENAAYNLSNLGRHTNGLPCSCRGGDADVLMAAYDPDAFVQVSPDALEGWVRSKATSSVRSWQSAQEAFRGASMARKTKSVLNAANTAASQIRSGFDTSVANAASSIEDLENIQSQLDADVAAYAESLDEGGPLAALPGATLETAGTSIRTVNVWSTLKDNVDGAKKG